MKLPSLIGRVGLFKTPPWEQPPEGQRGTPERTAPGPQQPSQPSAPKEPVRGSIPRPTVSYRGTIVHGPIGERPGATATVVKDGTFSCFIEIKDIPSTTIYAWASHNGQDKDISQVTNGSFWRITTPPLRAGMGGDSSRDTVVITVAYKDIDTKQAGEDAAETFTITVEAPDPILRREGALPRGYIPSQSKLQELGDNASNTNRMYRQRLPLYECWDERPGMGSGDGTEGGQRFPPAWSTAFRPYCPPTDLGGGLVGFVYGDGTQALLIVLDKPGLRMSDWYYGSQASSGWRVFGEYRCTPERVDAEEF